MHTAPFTFAVIADSHFHPPGIPEQAAWASDASFNDRNRCIVEAIRQAHPDFVIHLGDVPHPVPGLLAHEQALDVAQDLYASLGVPLYMVPGNHDVGDKPRPSSPGPAASTVHHDRFQQRWGAPWQAFSHKGCRFVLLDTPILNSGTPREAAQWQWLEQEVQDLQRSGQRWFAFLHYPPYLLHPEELEHYDNIARPGRDRLLDLLASAEAVFSGHVHHFFWLPRSPSQDLYIAPSTAFVRPGYSELSRIAPGPEQEHGRDDPDKLGWMFVHVAPHQRHRLEPVRLTSLPRAVGQTPPPPCPLGFTLRHAWDAVLDIPCDGLDPFQRKQARDDRTLLALWELGACRLRLPLSDLLLPQTRHRLRAWCLRQPDLRIAVFFDRLPDPEQRQIINENHDIIEALELILPSAAEPLPTDLRVPLWRSVLRRAPVRDGEAFSHFPAAGFPPEEARPDRMVRVPAELSPLDAAAPVQLIELPRGGEARMFTDDDAITARACEALLAAWAHPARRLFLDTFLDHDRGYFSRHGLLDRRGNPRPAFRALCTLGRLLPSQPLPILDQSQPAVRCFRVGAAGTLWLPLQTVESPPGTSLLTAQPLPAGQSRLPRWLSEYTL